MVFNRPALTRRVFDAIAQAKPTRLFIIADGPRVDRPDDNSRVMEVRSIVESIDWPCTVTRIYSEENLGCKLRVVTGLNEVFERVDRAIILEDDCLPSPAFFTYCSELLRVYETNARVFSISGTNLSHRRSPPGHYFSRYALMWGWATWRDRWQKYDPNPRDYLHVIFRTWRTKPISAAYWIKLFRLIATGKLDTWDYQWILTMWRHNGLACRPSLNLVQNIGFGPDATHTTNSNSSLAQIGFQSADDPLTTPLSPLVADSNMDKIDERDWAMINLRTLVLLYFPSLSKLRRRR
jgi:hypothetical protein